ncbi:hypothetical protein MRX96_035990 [Rhipicephalus microplus]
MELVVLCTNTYPPLDTSSPSCGPALNTMELSGGSEDEHGGGARSPAAGAVRGAAGTPPAPQQSPLRPTPSPGGAWPRRGDPSHRGRGPCRPPSVHSQTFLCLLDPHQVSLRAVRQIIFLNHSCLSKGTTNKCRHQCNYPRQQGGLGAMPGYGPPQGPAGYPAGRMGTQGGYPYGNSQYGGYGGSWRTYASHVPASTPSAEDVRLQQPHDSTRRGRGFAISVGRRSPPPPGGGPMPPGACYSQCPPAPMSGPSSLLSQQGGVGVLDEGSQASNASASSSLPEEHLGPADKGSSSKQPPMSHPPTPNTLPSPGGASMSSFHDEFESVSSPSWPRTPASPVVNSQVYEHHIIKRPDGLLKLYDMSEDPERRAFLDKLIVYNDERGTPITQCPTISKQPLDLFRLYLIVKDRGGFVEVTKAKHWKDVAGVLGIGASSSAAYTLRKQYIKHLLPFECKFDRGGHRPSAHYQPAGVCLPKEDQGNHVAFGCESRLWATCPDDGELPDQWRLPPWGTLPPEWSPPA